MDFILKKNKRFKNIFILRNCNENITVQSVNMLCTFRNITFEVITKCSIELEFAHVQNYRQHYEFAGNADESDSNNCSLDMCFHRKRFS